MALNNITLIGCGLVANAWLGQTRHMIGLLQRVREARVEVAGEVIGSIKHGLLVLVGVEQGDTDTQARRLAERLLNYRVFADSHGRMNQNVQQVKGGLLLVPQFTLVADTDQGNRPGFSRAADPEISQNLFDLLVLAVQQSGQTVATGRFGADMQVSLCNDGPVTFSLRVNPEQTHKSGN
jgi:D-tyrosyl-tRNA(Tyr) deacylase